MGEEVRGEASAVALESSSAGSIDARSTDDSYLLPADVVPPRPIVPPMGLSGVLDGYDPQAILDTSQFEINTVFLNVYDLGENQSLHTINALGTGNNNLLIGGVFHAGVEIYGREYCYGQTDDELTGIYALQPRMHAAHTYRTTVPLGTTGLAEVEVKSLLEHMKPNWLGERYDMFQQNCLHFCEEFLKELGVRRMPGWVDRASRAAALFDSTTEVASGAALEAMELARSATHDAMTTAQELAEVTQAQAAELAEAAQSQTNGLLEAAQLQAAGVQAQAEELAERVRVEGLSEVVQEHTQALSDNFWRLSQDVQRAASSTISGEPVPDETPGASLWHGLRNLFYTEAPPSNDSAAFSRTPEPEFIAGAVTAPASVSTPDKRALVTDEQPDE